MGIINNFLKRFGYLPANTIEPEIKEVVKEKYISPKQEKEVGEFFPAPITGQIPPRMDLKDFLESATGWVYSCISIIGEEVGKIEFKLYRRKPNQDVEEILEHPLLNLLSRVNPLTTKFDHFSLTQNYLDLAGEAPWYLDRDAKGEIVNLLLLRPDKLYIINSKDDKEVIEGYKYLINEEKYTFKDIDYEDLIFLRYPDMISGYRGRSPLMAGVTTFNLDEYAEKWNRNFFYNHAAPDSVLEMEGVLTKEQYKRLRAQWEERYKGIDNNFKTAILEGGMAYKSITPTHSDMDFIEMQKFCRDKILGLYRVPKAVIAQTEDVNYASAKTAIYIFEKFTIESKMQRLVEALNEFLVPNFGDDLILDFVSPVPADDEMEIKRYESGINNAYLTPNEVREQLMLEPVEGGDKLFISANMMPIDWEPTDTTAEDIDETKPKEEVKPTEEEKKQQRLNDKFKGRYLHKRGKEKLNLKVKKDIGNMVSDLVKAEFKELNPDSEFRKKQGEVFWKGLIRRTDAYEFRYQEILKRYFNRQKRVVLTLLNKKEVKAIKDAQLDVEKEGEELIKISLPFFNELMLTISKDAKRFWKLPGNMRTIDTRNYLKVREKILKNINKTTNKKLQNVIQKGLDEGEGIDKISKRITEEFEGFTRQRSKTIARTEVIKAGNEAILETFKQSNVVYGKEWITAMDERVCDECLAMERNSSYRTRDLDTNFFNKGDKIQYMTDDGIQEREIDEDIAAPYLHMNCRCTIRPIYKF